LCQKYISIQYNKEIISLCENYFQTQILKSETLLEKLEIYHLTITYTVSLSNLQKVTTLKSLSFTYYYFIYTCVRFRASFQLNLCTNLKIRSNASWQIEHKKNGGDDFENFILSSIFICNGHSNIYLNYDTFISVNKYFTIIFVYWHTSIISIFIYTIIISIYYVCFDFYNTI